MTPNPKTAQESADRANYGARHYPDHVRGMALYRARVARLANARRHGYHGPLTRDEVARMATR